MDGGHRGVLKPALVLFSLILGIYAAVAGLKPPKALPDSAPPAEFSAGRAMRYVHKLAAKPHPLASAAHDEVLENILGLWRALGFELEVQTAVLVDEKRGKAARVANVLVRMKGTEAGKAAMFVAHYDSVPFSPGAADDAAGVAVLLETARALKTGPAPEHDIIFLITDGEEAGLFGARAFVQEHPWAADVGLVVNFEARGTSGPSVMFETGPGNGSIIKAFAAAAPRPQATSLAASIYRRMPNGTDLSVFLEAGMQGLNFAFIEEPNDYHTPHDTPDHLDPRSLQHHGSCALALARHFGKTGIPLKGTADAVYFNALGPGLVVYSLRTAWLAAILAVLFLSAAGVIGFRKGLLAPRKLLGSGLFIILVLVLCPVLALLFAKLVGFAHGKWLQAGEPGSNQHYFTAVLMLILSVFITLYGLFRRKSGWRNLAFAACSLGVLLTIGLTKALPGAGYITGWPSLLGAAALLAIFLIGNEGIDSPAGTAAVSLCAFGTALAFTPIIHFLFVALGLSPLGTAGVAVFITLAVLSLVPAVESIGRRGTAAWALLAFLAFAGFTIAGAVTTRYTVRHPRPSQMGYCLDMDVGRADWFIMSGVRDAWTARFMPAPKPGFRVGDPSIDHISFVSGKAPAIAPEPPSIEKLDVSDAGDGRLLRLRVRSPRRAAELAVATDKADVLEAEMNGIPMGRSVRKGKGFRFRFYAPGADGYELRLKLKGRKPLSLTVFEWVDGLPEIPGQAWPQPPPDIMPVRLLTIFRLTRAL
jgi:hypothetical protein